MRLSETKDEGELQISKGLLILRLGNYLDV